MSNKLPTIISLFSFGHSQDYQTKNAYDLACYLSREKSDKILLVDCDNQLSASLLFLGDNFNEFYSKENDTIFDGLKPVIYALFEEIKPLKCVQHNTYKNLFLLPGSEKIYEYENALRSSSSLDVPALKNIKGALYDLVLKTAKSIGAKYIIFNAGLLSSELSRNLFLITDGVILSLKNDEYFNISLKTFTNFFKKWSKEAQAVHGDCLNSAYPMPLKKAKEFITCIVDGGITAKKEDIIKNTLSQNMLSNKIVNYAQDIKYFDDIADITITIYYGRFYFYKI